MQKNFVLESNFFISSDEVKIHYQKSPHLGLSPTLLLIHGLGHDSRIWRDIQEKLFEEKFSSISIDLRGHGMSEDPQEVESYKFDRLANDICDLVQNLKLPPVVLVGHSLGGMVAMYLAGKNKLPLAGLVLIETTSHVDLFGLQASKVGHVLSALAYVLPNGRKKKHENYDKFKDGLDFDIDRIKSDIDSTSLRSYLLSCSVAASFDATELLQSIKIPTLVIAGEKDAVIPPQIAIDLKNQIKNADFALIPDANHIVTISDPDNLARIIMKFAKKL